MKESSYKSRFVLRAGWRLSKGESNCLTTQRGDSGKEEAVAEKLESGGRRTDA